MIQDLIISGENNMIMITTNALVKIRDILQEENNLSAKIRAFVQGGGCSGFSYGFTIDTEQTEDDFVIADNTVLVDGSSMQYLEGATIDYVEDLVGSSFKVINPNAETTCGCGSSFTLTQDFFNK